MEGLSIVEAKNKAFVDAMSVFDQRSSVVYTTAGAIKLLGYQSLRFNQLHAVMVKHGKWFRYSTGNETIELEVSHTPASAVGQLLTVRRSLMWSIRRRSRP